MKTTRNCLAHSGAGEKSSRFMWYGGLSLLWKHVSDIYYANLNREIKLLPKLTHEHIDLTCLSVMRVNLAAQVLSSKMSTVLSTFGPPAAAATAKFCKMMDTFFDCLNVRSLKELIKNAKNI